jgi:lysophospholipase L1-like esterase
MRFAGALVLGLAVSGCAPPPPPVAAATPVTEVMPAGFETTPHEGLNGFFYDLQLLEQGRRKTVTIVQIGDSHTAGDYFSGQMRSDFQAQFGNAGIGTRVAGLPFYGVRQLDMKISQTGHWTYENSLTKPDFPDYGLSGFTAISHSVGASLSLTVTDPRGFDSGAVDVVTKPGGGRLSIQVDGVEIESVATAGPPAGQMRHVAFHAPHDGAQQLTLVARAAGIEILDWTTARRDAGVVLDSFGVVGSTVGVTQNWNPALVQAQLQALKPALIILAYGTNEGAHPDFSPQDYASVYGGLLAHLRDWAPEASILLISPTDGAHHPAGCTDDGCPWVTLPSLAAVRQVQWQLAYAHHAALWDASVPEVQAGGINAWVDEKPPLARADHIHFTAAGYSLLGNTLYAWLMQHFANYTQAHP